MSFDEFVQGRDWRGLKQIKLDSGSSYGIQQRLGYWVYRQFNQPASRQSSCRFVLNLGGSDDYRGCYGVEEVVRKAFVRYNWPNLATPQGNLYKLDNQTSTWSVDSYRWRGTDPNQYVPIPFSPKTNEVGGDYRDLVNLCNVLNNVPLSSRRTELEKIMNVDRQLAVLAVCSSLGDSDGLFNNMRELNNHYWYHREDTGKLEVIPWDVDGSFVYQPFDTSAWKWFYETRPAQGGNNPSVLNAWIPSDRVARESFVAKVRQVVAGPLSSARSRADFIYNQIKSHVYADPYKPITNAEFDAHHQAVRNWIPQRITFLQGETAVPAVTIAAVDGTGSEPGSDTLSFRVSRTGATSAPLTVDLTIGGTAGNGTDYTTLGTSVTIARGQSSVTVTVTPKDDTTYEGAETIALAIAAHASYTIGTASSATLSIADNESPPVVLPTVTITATDNAAAEPSSVGVFTVARTGATTAALNVMLTRSGTAGAGDCNAMPTTLTIPAGSGSATITVTPVDDALVEGPETVILTIAANPAAYTVGTSSSDTVTIADNDTIPPPLPTVTIVATDNAAAEPSSVGVFAVTRTGATTAALNVGLTRSGTASAGDCNAMPTTVTIPAGSGSVTITLTPVDDTTVEGPETVILTIATSAAYTVGTASATVTIADNDSALLPSVTIAPTDPDAAEPSSAGVFTVSRTGATTAALNVSLARSGTASVGDCNAVPTMVTIPIGSGSVTITVTPVDDTAVEGPETVILTIAPNNDYTVGTPSSATVTIADNDAATGGLSGTYYDNENFTGTSVTRTDATVDFNWADQAPAPGIGPDTFSIRWTGRIRAQSSETYTFYTFTNDGVRLWVEGEFLVDKWVQQSGGIEWSAQMALQAGRWYTVQMDYYEGVGNSVARLLWSSPSIPKQVIPQSALDPALGAPDSRDNDGDGVPNDSDLDDDNDGIPDLQDPDRDGDTLTNVAENASGSDPDDRTSPNAGGIPPVASDGDNDNGHGPFLINDKCGGSIPAGEVGGLIAVGLVLALLTFGDFRKRR